MPRVKIIFSKDKETKRTYRYSFINKSKDISGICYFPKEKLKKKYGNDIPESFGGEIHLPKATEE